MKVMMLIFTILFSFQICFANVIERFSCINLESQEGDVSIEAVYIETVIGDKLTTRFLKRIAIESEGELQFDKTYFLLGKILGGDSVFLGKDIANRNIEFQVFGDRAEVSIDEFVIKLHCEQI